MAKYDVYKDGEGDWTIVPAGAALVAPVVVAAMNGKAVADLAEVEKTANAKLAAFDRNKTNVTSQSIIDGFGPYELVGSIEVAE